MQEKYLPNGLEFKLRLNRSSPQFCLMSDDYPAKIKIDTAILRVRNVQLLPAISNELNQTIAHHNAKFPIRRVEVKTFTISSGTISKIEDHLLTGQLPKRVFIGLVTNEAFNGNLDTNHFTPASNLGYLAPPQDNFSWVPNCSLGPPGWETKVSSKKFWFGLCEIAWFLCQPIANLRRGVCL